MTLDAAAIAELAIRIADAEALIALEAAIEALLVLKVIAEAEIVEDAAISAWAFLNLRALAEIPEDALIVADPTLTSPPLAATVAFAAINAAADVIETASALILLIAPIAELPAIAVTADAEMVEDAVSNAWTFWNFCAEAVIVAALESAALPEMVLSALALTTDNAVIADEAVVTD